MAFGSAEPAEYDVFGTIQISKFFSIEWYSFCVFIGLMADVVIARYFKRRNVKSFMVYFVLEIRQVDYKAVFLHNSKETTISVTYKPVAIWSSRGSKIELSLPKLVINWKGLEADWLEAAFKLDPTTPSGKDHLQESSPALSAASDSTYIDDASVNASDLDVDYDLDRFF
ncbi:hypothetical protein BT63DRAFT_416737 [Microthyrium microscopicum]|uniref:Uncharacterized protein n=1 Tax=Microthyrium microscopicum TaxID=703497 RepID=A0A6A6U4Y9_9PEZI|nr:hypothetical protein BT63DRAFT_416737 [Microthyrium microscopicum]